MKYIRRGLLDPQKLEKISAYINDPGSQELFTLFINFAHKHQAIQFFGIIGRIFLNLILLLLVVFAHEFSTKTDAFLAWLVALSIVSGCVVIVITRESHFMNLYNRLAGSTLDEILLQLVNQYRTSLAVLLPSMPDIHKITRDIEIGGLSQNNFLIGAANIISVSLSSGFTLTYYFYSGSSYYLQVTFILLLILALFLLFLFWGSLFSKKQIQFKRLVDQISLSYRDAMSLLYEAPINAYKSSFLTQLYSTVRTTDMINLINNFTTLLLPLIFYVIHVTAITDKYSLQIFTVALLAITRLFSASRMINDKYVVDISHRRTLELDVLMHALLKMSSEMTETIYQKKRQDYLANAVEELRTGLAVKNLRYVVGRESSKKEVVLERAYFEKGKISFIIGPTGIGKSILGRVLTLQYADFSADLMAINGTDLRAYNSLNDIKTQLHFSSLRSIHSSFRAAVSAYFMKYSEFCRIYDLLGSFVMPKEQFMQHFVQNSKYYGKSTLEALDEIIGTANVNGTIAFHDKQLQQLRDYYRNFKAAEPRNEDDYQVYLNAAIVEYITFNHLKQYIPEASTYFMDAILSEPPVSQGQRRRILYALDVLVKGKLFIIDEPFSNIDGETAANIMRSLVTYTQETDSVVMILDQKLQDPLWEIATKDNAAGAVLGFENVGEQQLRLEHLQPAPLAK